MTLFVIANKLTTAANAILLQYTAPVHVALLAAWILKERTTLRDWLTIAAVLTGMLLFFKANDRRFGQGGSETRRDPGHAAAQRS